MKKTKEFVIKEKSTTKNKEKQEKSKPKLNSKKEVNIKCFKDMTNKSNYIKKDSVKKSQMKLNDRDNSWNKVINTSNFEHVNQNLSSNFNKQIELKSQLIEKLTDLDLEEPKEANLLKILPESKNNLSFFPSGFSTIKPQSTNQFKSVRKAPQNLIKEEQVETRGNRALIAKMAKSSTPEFLNKSYSKHHNKIPPKSYIQQLANKNSAEILNEDRHASVVQLESDYVDNKILPNQALTEDQPTLLKDFNNFYSSKLESIKNSSKEEAKYFHHNVMKELNKDSLRNNFLTNGLSTQVRYTNGINDKSNFVFHKEEKWICYLCYDNIVIESLEETCDCNQIVFDYSERLQEISNFDINEPEKNNFSDHQVYDFRSIKKKTMLSSLNKNYSNLSNIVLSENGKYLLVYSKTNPCILSFDVSEVKSLSTCQRACDLLLSVDKNSKEYNDLLDILNSINKSKERDSLKNDTSIKDLNLLSLKLMQTLNKNKINNEVDNELKEYLTNQLKVSATSIFLYQKNKIKPISKSLIKQKEIYSVEIPSSNNFCIFLSANNNRETYVTVLDFFNNEILTTTLLSSYLKDLKFNIFLTTNEFVTIGNNFYTFWRISQENTLQYQHGDLELIKSKKEDLVITCLEFTPPLSLTCTILLILGLKTGELLCIDSKTNTIVLIINPNSEINNLYNVNNNDYNNNKFFSNLSKNKNNHEVSKIFCGFSYFIIVVGEKLRYYQLPSLRDIKHDNLNFLTNEEKEISFDSEICSVDFDLARSLGMLRTKLGKIYYFNLKEGVNFKLLSPLVIDCLVPNSENSICISKNEIVSCIIVNKNIQKCSLRKIDFKSGKFEDLETDIVKENNTNKNFSNNEQYYIITGHKESIKVWNFPDNKLNFEFQVVNEELVTLSIAPNDLIIVASFNSGSIRFFKISSNNEDDKPNYFIGKFKSVSYEYITSFNFLSDGKYAFAVDNNNSLFLFKIDSYEPLLIQVHHILNVQGQINKFDFCYTESFNKFGLMISNQCYQVYNRKYTNILKNLSYDSSIPQFYLFDKVDFFEEFSAVKQKHLKNKPENENKEDLKLEQFSTEFCPRYKGLVYMCSNYTKMIVVRNYDIHQTVAAVSLDYNPILFRISMNAAYFIVFDASGKCYFYNLLQFDDLEKSNFNFIENPVPIIIQNTLISNYFEISNSKTKPTLIFSMSNNGKHYVVATKYNFYTNSLFFK